jgi:NAD(P)-dependent dehydrogenase (short-subunit alcohol dehydrogenase family)
MDMQGKIALVTAAASGTGRAGALILAREGASVAVVDQNEAGAEAVVDEIRKGGGRALALTGDLRDDVFAREIVAATMKEFGGLDCLWNHLGTPGPAAIDDMDGWDLSIDLNLRSQLITTNAALSHMAARRAGSIRHHRKDVRQRVKFHRCYSLADGARFLFGRGFVLPAAP